MVTSLTLWLGLPSDTGQVWCRALAPTLLNRRNRGDYLGEDKHMAFCPRRASPQLQCCGGGGRGRRRQWP